MIYNFNLGIGWASSGVEYAQSYRANLFRRIKQPCRFIFTDMFLQENIEHMTENIGFLDEEVIWLYQYFTDYDIAPVSYTLKELEQDITGGEYTFTREGKIAKYIFPGQNNFYTAYLVSEDSDKVHRVERVSNGCLIRKDYYTTGRLFAEYYAPKDNKAHVYLRRFFNRDGSIAYEEIVDGDSVTYRMKDTVLYSKEELVGYMVRCLNLTAEDIVIIDRTTGIGQAILMNIGDAKVGIVIHADHFSEGNSNEDNVLWNNYYEYAFAQHNHIDFYITATDAQNRLLREQFMGNVGVEPNVITIPVGSIDELKRPKGERVKHSLITASRLADEKHVDWIIEAVVKARETIGDITLDIYGKGALEKELTQLIQDNDAEEYVRLMGQQDLSDVYENYEAYISGSTSEGFGLTLLEAIGAGLPLIGFNVRYGNQTFIRDGKNGYLIDIDDDMSVKDKVELLADRIIRLFNQETLSEFQEESYTVASRYLTREVENQWREGIETII